MLFELCGAFQNNNSVNSVAFRILINTHVLRHVYTFPNPLADRLKEMGFSFGSTFKILE